MMMPLKSPNMMSTTGRIPVIAAPTASPVKPASEIGVSSTRSGPNSSTSPFRTLKVVPASAMSSPRMKTVGSRRSSSASASLIASPKVSSRSDVDMFTHLFRRRERRVEGKRQGVLHFTVYRFFDLLENPFICHLMLEQPFRKNLERV